MKKFILSLTLIFALFFSILIGVSIYVASLLSPQFIVHQLEGLFNARFALKDYSVGILSGGSIDIEGVGIAPRDRFANQAIALAKRPPLRDADKALSLQKLSLHLDLAQLFSGVFRLNGFVLDEPQIRMILYANGGNNLAPLFSTPPIVAGKRNPALNAARKKEKEPEKTKPKSKENESQSAGLKAADIPLAASLGEIGIKNGSIELTLQQTGDSLRMQQLDFLVKNIEFDPQDLQNKNGADVHFDMQLLLFAKSKKETGKFLISSSGHVIPFHKITGRIDPNVIYQLTIKKNTYLSGFNVLEKLSGQMENLKKANISLAKLREKAILQQDTATKVRYRRGIVTVLSDTKFLTQNFDFTLKQGARFILTNSAHSMHAELLASSADSQQALSALDAALVKALKLKPNEAQGMRNKHFASNIKNGRIYFSFISQGALSNPNVKLTTELPSINRLAKDAASHLLAKEKKKLKARAQKEAEAAKDKYKEQAVEKAKEEGKKLLKKLF